MKILEQKVVEGIKIQENKSITKYVLDSERKYSVQWNPERQMRRLIDRFFFSRD